MNGIAGLRIFKAVICLFGGGTEGCKVSGVFKKAAALLTVFNISLYMLCACKTEILPVPEYPLEADTIFEALQEWGVLCRVEEDVWVRETRPGQLFYSLYSVENGELIGSVSSGEKDGERVLFISFPPYLSTNALPLQECDGAVIFATRLFGGFKSAHQVYDSFVQEYDTVNTERVQFAVSVRSSMPAREGESKWETSIEGTACRINLEQPKLSEPQEYVLEIVLASDWDTFFG